MKKILVAVLIYYHRYISPWLPPACRFQPTCSEYAVQVIEKYGVVKGIGLSCRRLIKCNPFHPGGYDPVP